jgi:hypothetical protein
VLMVRIELTEDDSLAAIRARSKFGIAIAAMIRMIATTISNSINEKPFCFRISFFLPCYLYSASLVSKAISMVFSSEHNDYDSTQTERPASRVASGSSMGRREYAAIAHVQADDRVGRGTP